MVSFNVVSILETCFRSGTIYNLILILQAALILLAACACAMPQRPEPIHPPNAAGLLGGQQPPEEAIADQVSAARRLRHFNSLLK